uniref:Crotamine-Uro-1 n=1 Tax=Uromastyx aegyptia TaxID=103697 RepID=M9T5K8_9SAUR|nr:crotamine-Uro-1 [Uromastyx aegyptia]
MKFLYLLCAVLFLGLLQGPGVTQAVDSYEECSRTRASACYSFLCPRGTVTIGKCSWTQKCCQSVLGK